MEDVQNISQVYDNLSLSQSFKVVSRIIILKFCNLEYACLLPYTGGKWHKFSKLSSVKFELSKDALQIYSWTRL
jgi:hypothetical protein